MTRKSTNNPFIPLVIEKWNELIDFDEFSFSKLIEKISKLIVFIFLILLIPVGVVESIRASLYNLQKNAAYSLSRSVDFSERFAVGVEIGIYFLLSLPFLIILLPYWIIAGTVIFLSKNKILFLLIVVMAILAYIFLKDTVMYYVTDLWQIDFLQSGNVVTDTMSLDYSETL